MDALDTLISQFANRQAVIVIATCIFCVCCVGSTIVMILWALFLLSDHRAARQNRDFQLRISLRQSTLKETAKIMQKPQQLVQTRQATSIEVPLAKNNAVVDTNNKLDENLVDLRTPSARPLHYQQQINHLIYEQIKLKQDLQKKPVCKPKMLSDGNPFMQGVSAIKNNQQLKGYQL